MNPLFTRSGLTLLESLSFTRTIYAFDFDGTLSRIVPVPSDATLTVATARLLEQLSQLAPVAIVSGRSIEDLRKRLPFQPQYLIGNHGLEGLGTSHLSLERAKEQSRQWRIALDKIGLGTGIEIEDKLYSLAIHFRRSRNKKISKKQIQQAVATLTPAPRVIHGKAVVNLLPLGSPHKGAALIELMRLSGAKHVFYIGDDDTDEDVFSLNEDKIMLTVRVGRKKSSHARYFIERQSDISRLLKHIISFQKKGHPK